MLSGPACCVGWWPVWRLRERSQSVSPSLESGHSSRSRARRAGNNSLSVQDFLSEDSCLGGRREVWGSQCLSVIWWPSAVERLQSGRGWYFLPYVATSLEKHSDNPGQTSSHLTRKFDKEVNSPIVLEGSQLTTYRLLSPVCKYSRDHKDHKSVSVLQGRGWTTTQRGRCELWWPKVNIERHLLSELF